MQKSDKLFDYKVDFICRSEEAVLLNNLSRWAWKYGRLVTIHTLITNPMQILVHLSYARWYKPVRKP